jgi:hypothetical protein
MGGPGKGVTVADGGAGVGRATVAEGGAGVSVGGKLSPAQASETSKQVNSSGRNLRLRVIGVSRITEHKFQLCGPILTEEITAVKDHRIALG